MDRRFSERYVVAFPVRVEWKEDGKEIIEEGLTENIGLTGTLVYLPKRLPEVGSEVNLVVTEHPKYIVKVSASVLRVERNVARPTCALLLNEITPDWEEKVWKHAARIASTDSIETEDDE